MQPGNPAFAGANPNAAGKSPILRVNCVPPAPIKKTPALPQVVDCQLSGRLDSNQRPPAPKAGALTGLRYTPSVSFFRCCLRRCRLAAPFAFQNSRPPSAALCRCRLLHYAAANRCRLLARRCRPSTVATGPSLPPWRAGHLSEVRGAKITAFSVPTNFSLRNLSPAEGSSPPKEPPPQRGTVARRHCRRMARRPEARRIAALPLPRRHCRPKALPPNGPPPGSPQNCRAPAAAEAL